MPGEATKSLAGFSTAVRPVYESVFADHTVLIAQLENMEESIDGTFDRNVSKPHCSKGTQR